jgi:hypothetical protein
VGDDGLCDACDERGVESPTEPVAGRAPTAGACYQHQYTPASVFCVRCDRPMCRGCARPVAGRFACSDCVDLIGRDHGGPRPMEWAMAALLLVAVAVVYVLARLSGLL